ncbi:MAG TPA: hypothetical protein VIE65_20685 [Methylobacter sp.]|jgi:hypothetical protein
MKLLGFSPDLDPMTPGVITDCEMLLPTLKGMKGAPSGTGIYPALASDCRGAAVVRKTDDTSRTFAGTQTDLYEGLSGAWTSVSRAGSYVGGLESRWRFTQFGNVTICCNKIDATQNSVNTGAFADLTGAPKASFIDTTAGFVMLADYDDGVNNYQDGWYCSALNDYTGWTNSIATQSASGRLLDTPGPIKGLRQLGKQFVFYKERSMYLATYAGPPFIWDIQLIPGEIGASSHEAVVNIGTAHIFVGYEDFYMFDGTRPVAIGGPVREWFFRQLNQKYRYKIQGLHDRTNSTVHFYYPSASSTTLDSCIVYNYKSDKWGKADRNIETVVEVLSGGYTIDGMDALSSTIDGLPAIPFDSPFWNASSVELGVVNTAHVLQTLSGMSVQATMQMGDAGDDFIYTLLRRVRPRFSVRPASATLLNKYKALSGDTYTSGALTNMTGDSFDVLRSAHWHSALFTFNGDFEVEELNVDSIEDGSD